jgi:hypothetical protein
MVRPPFLSSSSGYSILDVVEHSVITAFQRVKTILKTVDKVYISVPQPSYHGGIHSLFISQGTPTSGNVCRPENKEACGSERGLLQYCQFPDKNSHDALRDIWNFAVFQNFLRTCSTISRGDTNDVLRTPGWETLL